MNRRGAIFLALWAGIGLSVIASCGGGGSDPNAFTLCGNGRIDSGEGCDDGNTVDTDDCTSACLPARCGDGVVHAGVEQCDGLNLNGSDCGTLGLSGGGLRCDASCQYDTSSCSPAFTPTATPTLTPSSTGTPTATPTFLTAPPTDTPTPTVTPTPNPCGDGFLEPPESCETCPADCQILACTPGMPMQQFGVDFTAPAGSSPSAVAVLIGYQSDRVSLPGTGSAAGSRITGRPSGTSQLVNDLDYAVRVTIVGSPGESIPTGQLIVVDFDSCTGAPAVSPADFGCIIQSCGSSFGPIDGCMCTVTLPMATP
jgi:cysteine-rich repeat protein